MQGTGRKYFATQQSIQQRRLACSHTIECRDVNFTLLQLLRNNRDLGELLGQLGPYRRGYSGISKQGLYVLVGI